MSLHRVWRDLGFWADRFLQFSHSVCKVIPSRHLTRYNALRDEALHMHIQHWSVGWNHGAATYLELMFNVMICFAHEWQSSLQLDVLLSCGHCYHNSKHSLVIVMMLVLLMKAVKSFLETSQCTYNTSTWKCTKKQITRCEKKILSSVSKDPD